MHLTALLLLASVLSPVRTWNSPSKPVEVSVNAAAPARLVLTTFNGTAVPATGPVDVSGEKTVDLAKIFPPIANGGTFVLFLVPKDGKTAQFLGTPLVVESIPDKRGGRPGPIVIRIQPLEYAVMDTKQGPLKMMFYYDVAHHTVDNFLDLAKGGYYDKLTFHRIVPGFVIQGGDPRGDGSGGPGYQVEGEFNERPHLEGVLSMARLGDPLVDSAGSQFFVCLDYSHTKSLDGKYTAFGRVVDGMDAVKKIAAAPLADPENGVPKEPQVIENVVVKPVTAEENPYAEMFHLKEGDAK